MGNRAIISYARYAAVGALLFCPFGRKAALVGATSGAALRALEWVPHDKTVAYSRDFRALFYCAELKFFHSMPKREDKGGLAVVFIHGDHSDPFTFHHLAKQIKQPLFAISHSNPYEAMAKFKALLDELGMRPIFVIGHSRGAILGNAYAGDPRIVGVAAIAGRGSGALPHPKVVSIGASSDWLVPLEEALRGAEHHEIPGTGHLSILFDERTEEIVLDALKRAACY